MEVESILTARQQKAIIKAYEEYGSVKKVTLATGFNFRTIKKYLIEADIYKGKERNKRTGVTILVDEQSYSFESITSAAGFLTRRDEEIKRKLLSKSETFEDGYNYPVLKVSSYRRYINYAISGELDKLLKRDFDWEVKING